MLNIKKIFLFFILFSNFNNIFSADIEKAQIRLENCKKEYHSLSSSNKTKILKTLKEIIEAFKLLLEIDDRLNLQENTHLGELLVQFVEKGDNALLDDVKDIDEINFFIASKPKLKILEYLEELMYKEEDISIEDQMIINFYNVIWDLNKTKKYYFYFLSYTIFNKKGFVGTFIKLVNDLEENKTILSGL